MEGHKITCQYLMIACNSHCLHTKDIMTSFRLARPAAKEGKVDEMDNLSGSQHWVSVRSRHGQVPNAAFVVWEERKHLPLHNEHYQISCLRSLQCHCHTGMLFLATKNHLKTEASIPRNGVMIWLIFSGLRLLCRLLFSAPSDLYHHKSNEAS